MARSSETTATSLLVIAAPAVFVLLWSSGFIGAKYGLPYAEPFTFLLLRFVVVTVLFAAAALAVGAKWPTGAGMLHVAVAGILIHATYLGGVFVAIHRGLPAGTAALVTALQPLLTAIAAGPYLGERITARQWIGLILGLFGVLLVVQRKLGVSEGDIGAVIAALIAVLGITAGTLYQKRHGGAMDVRTGSVVQFGASALVILPLAWLSETMEVRWSSEFVFALGWLCVVLSLGAISLLLWLIRHGAAARVASLFYMVPPATAVTAWILFDETFGLDGLIGMAVVVTGVALVTVSPKPS